MADLNYHHLQYFWTVAREGSVSRAARRLGLSQPAVSAQIRTLEQSLGERLFLRKGRGIALTEFGHLVNGYADQIFAVGRELSDAVRDRPTERPLRLLVGVAHGMPKLVVHHLLEPALRLSRPVRLIVRDDRHERLLADLVIDQLDLVLADAPASPASHAKVFNHPLGEGGVTIFGAPSLIATHKARFPTNLDGAPFLLPSEGTTLRRSLEDWFQRHEIRPRIVGEIADTTVLREFGRSGSGFFPALAIVAEEVSRVHGVKAVGQADGLRERFYAISLERRLKHPAVLAIIEHARKGLFD